ncbi:membrane-bound polysaccharide biosynthesis protein [Streptomyces spiroverticillatus]|uniref:Membrane-bound polysaccharide biosynthesis protein n=1 Tax=Streptomyces finlayi TaxID=67296 RepID=A0A919CD59_9ACTN|nr:Wzz/FepE/Etk N-terminal domain-containing protein [Streptomyces finlayi]GHA27339.1 membrane-bound polysaccharide biosynthesis protein [Streptomyces spiroverticillatus]GHD08500.1 membrane-bound polysaccharide biosynthesis protein [Streptomyces finlayi]
MTTHATAHPEPPATAPLIDLQALVAAVRRRRRLWLTLAFLGLVAGSALAVLLPPPPTAVTKVLVAHREDQPNDTGTLIRTDVALLGTTRIADAALRSLDSAEKAEDFLKDYTGLGLTNNLLQIEVKAKTNTEAVARAGALANAFVADHVRRMRETAKAEAKALLDQRDRMRVELAQVNETIGKQPPTTDPKGAAGAETLYARRAELNSRIADFDQRAAEAGTGTPRLVSGTQIVDAPRALKHSLLKGLATKGGIGLALGLVLGIALAAVGSVVGDRPVLRRDIAAHLGASVVAELPGRPGLLWRRRRTRAARARLATSLARTVRGSTEPLSLLELGCARSAGTIALDLARTLAQDGPVVVVDGLPGARLAKRRPKPGDPDVVGGERAGSLRAEERQIGVGSVAPGTAWTDLQYLGSRTVLVVRTGHGSTAWLHTVARQLADQHIPVIGVVLIDADPRDRTDGTLWDVVHTALRGLADRNEPHPHHSDRNDPQTHQNGSRQPRTERLPLWAARVPDDETEVR